MPFGTQNNNNGNRSHNNGFSRGPHQQQDPFAPLPSSTNAPGNTSLPDPFAPLPRSNPFRSAPRSNHRDRAMHAERPSQFSFGSSHPAFAAGGTPSAFIGTDTRHDPGFGRASNGFGFGAQPAPAPVPADPFAPRPPQNHRRHSAGPTFNRHAPERAQMQDPFAQRTSQPTSGAANAHNGRSLTSKLYIPRVPQNMFNRRAIFRYFGNCPNVHILNVSLRGSNVSRDAKRTAVIEFQTPQETTTAMQFVRQDRGSPFQALYFRDSAPPNMAMGNHAMDDDQAQLPLPRDSYAHQPTPMSDELLFSFVPKELFRKEAIRQLFNSISENRVLSVSTRSRTLRDGNEKRTAIITFSDVGAAKTALDGLPLYRGEPLNVSYRVRPPHLQGNERNDNQNSYPTGAVDLELSTPHDSTSGMQFAQEPARNGASTGFAVGNGERNATSGSTSFAQNSFGSGQGAHDHNFTGVQPQVPKTATIDKDEAIALLQRQIAEKEEEAARARRHNQRKPRKSDSRSANNHSKIADKAPKPTIGGRLGMQAQSSKRVVRESTNKGSAWRNVGAKMSLADATQFVGTCQTMCPEKEVSERILQRDISIFETKGGQPDARMAVKKYRRSAAISENPQPEEVRPPDVLVRTMEHLKDICDNTERSFVDIHNFVRDRTRSLRQDFTFQGVREEKCIQVHEESVRFHIMSEHRLTGTDPAKFSSKQNREQLDKCLISLRELYDLRREKGLPMAPNEPEMQAYYLLTVMSNAQACVQICTGLDKEVRKSAPVQFALHIVKSASPAMGNYFAYFACVRAAPYLMSCLLQTQFTRIRCHAVAVLNSTHGNMSSSDNVPISKLTLQLGFDNDEETIEFCSTVGLNVAPMYIPKQGTSTSVQSVLFPSRDFRRANAAKVQPRPSQVVVESKSDGLKPSSIIAGLKAIDYDLSQLPCVTRSSLRRLSKTTVDKPLRSVKELASIRTRSDLASPATDSGEGNAEQSPAPGRKKVSILDRLSTRAHERNVLDASGSNHPSSASLERGTVAQEIRSIPSSSSPVKTPEQRRSKVSTEIASNPVTPAVPEGEGTPVATHKHIEPFLTPRDSSKRKRVRFDLGIAEQDPSSTQGGAEAILENPKRQKSEEAGAFSFKHAPQKPSKQQRSATGALESPSLEHAARQESPKTAEKSHVADAEDKASSEKILEEQARAAEEAKRAEELKRVQELKRVEELKRTEGLKRMEELKRAEELKRKHMFEMAVLRRREELERARIELEQETARAEAFQNFERTIVRSVETAEDLKARLNKIDETFKSFSRFDGLPLVSLDKCKEANREFDEIAKRLYECYDEVQNVVPLTQLGQNAKETLMKYLSEIDALGKAVWKLVWKAEALCLHNPSWITGMDSQYYAIRRGSARETILEREPERLERKRRDDPAPYVSKRSKRALHLSV